MLALSCLCSRYARPQGRRLGWVLGSSVLTRVLPLSVVWEPTGDGTRVISLADNHLLLWDLQASSRRALVGKRLSRF